jgi:hypothetical protein
MSQKKYREGGPARPVDLTDRQVDALAAGGQLGLGRKGAEHAGPRDLSEKDVEALIGGGTLDLEELSPLPSVEGHQAPRDLTEDDVEALVAGKEIPIEERPVLKVQRPA